jgi:mono/diheme cytochrome c family protein
LRPAEIAVEWRKKQLRMEHAMRARVIKPGMHATVGALFVAALVLCAVPRTKAQSEARIWSGVFSAAQVERGKETFEANCARCHQSTLGGSDRAPALKGENFWSHWENETVNTLFIKVRDNMPPNLTGNQLEPQAKLDVVAYVLHANELPVGNAELKPEADSLDDIQILKKGTVASLPNFALVQVVGCLSKDSNDAWVLTRTSKPTATPQAIPASSGERGGADKPLGDGTFLLTSVKSFKPETQEGHRVEARGLIYRAPGDTRIDVTSLQSVASRCGG